MHVIDDKACQKIYIAFLYMNFACGGFLSMNPLCKKFSCCMLRSSVNPNFKLTQKHLDDKQRQRANKITLLYIPISQ